VELECSGPQFSPEKLGLRRAKPLFCQRVEADFYVPFMNSHVPIWDRLFEAVGLNFFKNVGGRLIKRNIPKT
jgi:hypothetical protein